MRTLSERAGEELLHTLEERFRANPLRHKGIEWEEVAARLEKAQQGMQEETPTEKLASPTSPASLASLAWMEETGGEPDVIGRNEHGEVIFGDCSPETPSGRVNLCYDEAALAGRKKNPPRGSAVGLATEMGVRLMTEDEYRALQAVEELDRKTSSWVETPEKIRKLGGALFCDRRFDTVFVYHNGADSYYSSRGFRAILTV